MKVVHALLFLLSLVVSSAWSATLRYPVDTGLYVPGSYASRYFFAGYDHLGEDINLAEGTSVKAIGSGTIVVYRPSSGYGELAVVIEHDLGKEYAFINAYGKIVVTRKILSIYGHLRTKKNRNDSQGLSWREGQEVNIGDVVGYVNNSSYPDGQSSDPNGDGLEHLHLGIRLSGKSSAEQADPGYWFRGYELSTDFGKHFGSADAVIQTVQNGGIQSLCSGLSSSGYGICWTPSSSSDVSCQSARSWLLYESYSTLTIVSSNQYCPTTEVTFSPYGSGGPVNALGGGGTGGTDTFNLKLDFDIMNSTSGQEIVAGTKDLVPGQVVNLKVQVQAKNGNTSTHMRPGKNRIEVDYYVRTGDDDWQFLSRQYIQATNLPSGGTHTETVQYTVPKSISTVSFKVKIDAEDEAYEANEGDNWSRIETFSVFYRRSLKKLLELTEE